MLLDMIQKMLGKEEVKAMPRFIAVHTAPFTEDQLKAAAKDTFSQGLSWKLTYCDFDDNKFFCEWEAPNREMIEQEFKDKNMPYDAVYPVRLFTVETAEFES
jgi:hypothetical protein